MPGQDEVKSNIWQLGPYLKASQWFTVSTILQFIIYIDQEATFIVHAYMFWVLVHMHVYTTLFIHTDRARSEDWKIIRSCTCKL